MKVAFVASEAFPFAKVGGLADVIGSLPQALKKQGLEPTIFIPWYWGIQGYYVGEAWFNFEGQREKIGIGHAEHGGVRYVLVGLGDFARDKPYGYPDDFRRFVRFAMAAAELLGDFDLVHAHDWQAALLPLLRNLAGSGPARSIPSTTWPTRGSGVRRTSTPGRACRARPTTGRASSTTARST